MHSGLEPSGGEIAEHAGASGSKRDSSQHVVCDHKAPVSAGTRFSQPSGSAQALSARSGKTGRGEPLADGGLSAPGWPQFSPQFSLQDSLQGSPMTGLASWTADAPLPGLRPFCNPCSGASRGKPMCGPRKWPDKKRFHRTRTAFCRPTAGPSKKAGCHRHRS